MSDETKEILTRIEIKIDKLDTRMDKSDLVQTSQAADIAHHIYRTELNEKRLEHIENNIEPIKAHVSRVDGALKLLGILSLVLTIIVGMYKFSMIF